MVASLHLAFRHFGTRETLGCSRVDKSRVQKVKLRYSSGNSTRSGENPLTIVETRVRRKLSLDYNLTITLSCSGSESLAKEKARLMYTAVKDLNTPEGDSFRKYFGKMRKFWQSAFSALPIMFSLLSKANSII